MAEVLQAAGQRREARGLGRQAHFGRLGRRRALPELPPRLMIELPAVPRFETTPATAAWRHLDARVGFEVLFLRREDGLVHIDGHSTALQEGEAWGIRYTITLDAGWVTRSAHVVGRSTLGEHEVRLEGDGRGQWRVDGEPKPKLSGCLDVDLEASVCTNALPVRRLGLRVGERAEAPAAYVRAPALGVERLEQSYVRLEDDSDGRPRYDYAAPAFDFSATLTYDRAGFVLDYPGIAVRVA